MNILHTITDPDLLTRLREMLGGSARAVKNSCEGNDLMSRTILRYIDGPGCDGK